MFSYLLATVKCGFAFELKSCCIFVLNKVEHVSIKGNLEAEPLHTRLDYCAIENQYVLNLFIFTRTIKLSSLKCLQVQVTEFAYSCKEISSLSLFLSIYIYISTGQNGHQNLLHHLI